MNTYVITLAPGGIVPDIAEHATTIQLRADDAIDAQRKAHWATGEPVVSAERIDFDLSADLAGTMITGGLPS